MKKIILALSLLIFTTASYANVIINSTRVIYPADSKEVSIQLFNTGTQPALVQSWVDDGDPESTPETADVPFILTPPVIKIEGNNGQQLRLKFTSANLAKDRESLFYINMLDIPPVPENGDAKNIMQIAIKTRIKLFYRPQNLATAITNIAENITMNKHGDQLSLKNNSPYYLNIVSLHKEGLKGSLLDEGTMIAPFSSFELKGKNQTATAGQYELSIIDDYGSISKFTVALR